MMNSVTKLRLHSVLNPFPFFKAFSTKASNPCNREKLVRLRNEMKNNKIDALIIPTNDPHMSEYIAPCFERRAFISEFTGSAGVAIVTMKEALLYTDGRYFKQAEMELSEDWKLMKQGMKDVPDLEQYMLHNLYAGSKVGIDPSVHSWNSLKVMNDTLCKNNISFTYLQENLIDKIWGTDRPAPPKNKVRVHPLQYAGKSVRNKLHEIREQMSKENVDSIIFSALDEIMWLFNIRGSDIPFNPVSICYAAITQDKALIFIDNNKLTQEVNDYFQKEQIDIKAYQEIDLFLKSIDKSDKVWIDKNSLNAALVNLLPKEQIVDKVSPIMLMKSCKNPKELEGLKQSHIRDGVAMVEFLSWLEEYLTNGNVISEYDLDLKLIEFRSKNPMFLEPSFATIAGVNANGAIVHYRASNNSCKILTKEDMLLLDSGGQYLDGTTDITRTIHFGKPSKEQIDMFTRVLQGHIGVSKLIFRQGISGCQIDALARMNLWQIGKDYNHGTGHGVGAALNVHEGPQRISPLIHSQTLEIGMVLSNEPGYYENDQYGIRIENLMYVEEKKDFPEFAGKKFFCFQPLTLVPIQTKLIDKELLSKEEIFWLNNYHSMVFKQIEPLLTSERAKLWLANATQPI